jgi:hypothetical protein
VSGYCVVLLGVSCILHREMVLFGDTLYLHFGNLEVGSWTLDMLRTCLTGAWS